MFQVTKLVSGSAGMVYEALVGVFIVTVYRVTQVHSTGEEEIIPLELWQVGNMEGTEE